MIDFLEDGISKVALVDRMQNDVALKVVNSARISYDKRKDAFDESDKKLCKFLLDNSHTSPYRHSYYTFHIKAPLFLMRQLTKYQVGSTFLSAEVNGEEVRLDLIDQMYDLDKGCSWNEVSGRYTQTSNEFYLPKTMRSNPSHGNKQSSGEYENPLHSHDVNYMEEQAAIRLMEVTCLDLIKTYEKLVKNGIAKEISRMLLPQNIYTEAFWTCSLQSIIHFLTQRLRGEAMHEIRQLAIAIQTLIKTDLEKIGVEL